MRKYLQPFEAGIRTQGSESDGTVRRVFLKANVVLVLVLVLVIIPTLSGVAWIA
jgi:hypothetical protein